MSTILKALQRLEQERGAGQPSVPTPVFSRPSATQGGVIGFMLNPNNRRVLAGILVLALSLAAIHVYRQSRSPVPEHKHPSAALEKSAPVPRSGQMAPRSSVSSFKELTDSLGTQDTKHGERSAADPPTDISKARPRDPEEHKNTQQADLPVLSKTRESQIQEDARRMPMVNDGQARDFIRPLPETKTDGMPEAGQPLSFEGNGETAAASEVDVPEKRAVPDPKAPSDVFKSTPILTDGRLKVHAIAWSERADDRMAVVNNRVIYEGDSMDSFMVVAIRPDDVVVREKGKGLWRVVFGRP